MPQEVNKVTKNIIKLLLIAFVIGLFQFSVCAKEEKVYKYYLGNVVNAGKDSGYSESEKIKRKDPHFGWDIGEFFIRGYSSDCKDENGDPVFLKNVGDKVSLWFTLKEDINKLDGDKDLSVSEDKNGYDEYFGIEKTNFGKGTLIVRHRDSENHWGEPVIYTDFLSAKVQEGADTEIQLFEEGDYEVALNYEIKEINMNIFGWKPFPSYHNYRIFFRFSVRNGNCMVYPFDVESGQELVNTAFTENGFYLDLANSKYLDISVKKEVMNKGLDGLVEDTRFNRPAKDGEHYTDEGIYTITAHNNYTNQKTVKKIYVGSNSILKAHVITGFSVEEINYLLTQGATITEEGQILSANNQFLVNPQPELDEEELQGQTENNDKILFWAVTYSMIVLFVFVAIVIVLIVVSRKKTVSDDKEVEQK